MKNFELTVFMGLKREIDSVKAIGGGVSEEPNMTDSDEYAQQFQNVFDSISVVKFLPKIAARIETHGDRFRESVGCVP